MPKLLVADSDCKLHDLYHNFFSRNGYEVETVSNGLDCIERIRLGSPDVLCLDTELCWGGSDGVIALMQEDALYSSIPVILIDQDQSEKDYSSQSKRSLLYQIQKPFRLSRLLSVLHTISPVKAEVPECLC